MLLFISVTPKIILFLWRLTISHPIINQLRTMRIKLLFAIAMVLFCLGGQHVSAQTFQSPSVAQQKDSVEVFDVNGVTFEMVWVKAGTLRMGGTVYKDEEPVHYEWVPSFSIGRTEVTQALWAAVMGTNPSYFKGDTRPVERVSWNDCQEFIKRLSSLTGRQFRLPDEKEWEFAARGGNQSHRFFFSGSDDVDLVAWYDENSCSMTHPVAQKRANELGLYDMSGNVWEWTSDNYSFDYNSPRNSSHRVLRGGCWYNAPTNCHLAFRFCHAPEQKYDNVGLRLAL